MKELKNISIIGTGNVAWHLGKAFVDRGLSVTQVFGRSPKRCKEYANAFNAEAISDLDKIDISVDLILICISDNNIFQVESKISAYKGIIAHTSGSMPIGSSSYNNGVFYPLQTFSKNIPVNFSNLPILIEGSNEETKTLLRDLALKLSSSVYAISSDQRKKLHVAAVFANNFSNHMFAQAYKICQENDVPFGVLHPLIEETARKAIQGNPFEKQTGPAIRKDDVTIAKHLELLQSDEQKKLYKTITESIIKSNEA